jgi:hypothetical protein
LKANEEALITEMFNDMGIKNIPQNTDEEDNSLEIKP